MDISVKEINTLLKRTVNEGSIKLYMNFDAVSEYLTRTYDCSVQNNNGYPNINGDMVCMKHNLVFYTKNWHIIQFEKIEGTGTNDDGKVKFELLVGKAWQFSRMREHHNKFMHPHLEDKIPTNCWWE